MSGPRSSDVADVAARRAAAVPGVLRLDAGPFGTLATYGPGGRVEGVTVDPAEAATQVVVHAAVRYGQPIPPLGEQVIREVDGELATAFPDVHFSVTFHVTDVDLPGETDALAALPAPPPRRELQ